ncbi:MAG: hypothetical protein ACKVOW_07200 [Chitinophagaceae bacterium]
MYGIILLSGLICLLQQGATEQIGYSSPGNIVIAKDSFSMRQIGKAATLKCVRPGARNSNCSVYTFIG